MDFAKLLAVLKIVRQAIKDILAIWGTTTPAGASHAQVSELQSALAEADVLIAEAEAASEPPAGVQAAFGDRIKKLIALLVKLLGGLGPILGG